MAMQPPLEKHIQRVILQWLNLQPGFFFFRINSGAFTGEHAGKRRFLKFNSAKGCSDIIGCTHGRFVACEVKRPGNSATPDQQAFLDHVEQNGGIALVVHSLDELRDGLRKHGVDV